MVPKAKMRLSNYKDCDSAVLFEMFDAILIYSLEPKNYHDYTKTDLNGFG